MEDSSSCEQTGVSRHPAVAEVGNITLHRSYQGNIVSVFVHNSI